jgi:hypothetical protein
MPTWLMTCGAVLVVGAVAVAVVLVRRRRPAALAFSQIDLVLRARGPSRCRAAVALWRYARNAGTPAMVQALESTEMALLAAIPDCPPGDKADLAAALEAASGSCRNRDAARRLMDLRNSLRGTSG